MSRLTKSVAPVCVGAYLASPLLFGLQSMSNVVNLLRVAIGLLLVAYGTTQWFKANTSERSSSKSPNGHPTSLESPPPRSTFKTCYLFYVKNLLLLPGAVAFVCWLLAFKLFGCGMSGASMEIYGCGGFGAVAAYLFLYAAMLVAAMLTLLIPLTVVYAIHESGKK